MLTHPRPAQPDQPLTEVIVQVGDGVPLSMTVGELREVG